MTLLRQTALALPLAVLLLCVGLWMGGHPETLPNFAREAFVEDDRAVRAQMVDYIRDNFYKPVKASQLDASELRGIVGGLNDRFSEYLTPEEKKKFQESIQGAFEGVGMAVEEDPRGLRVQRVFDGSPAKRAGLRKDDLITKVNGKSIAGVPSEVATARIKGPAGTPVRLEVVSGGGEGRRTLRLRRARVEVPVVETRIRQSGGRSLGVVELLSFTSGAHGQLRQEIDKILRSGADGLLLDLRGNGGGLLREAVLVSSIFVEDGLVTFTRGRTQPRREFEASEELDAIADDVPVVVLVDRGSASASEIVTGALRDRHRATVVGQRTFGKGVFQDVKELSNGGELKLTVGEYFLPSGENIGKKGIVPPVKAKDDPKTRRDEALPVALRELAEKAAAR